MSTAISYRGMCGIVGAALVAVWSVHQPISGGGQQHRRSKAGVGVGVGWVCNPTNRTKQSSQHVQVPSVPHRCTTYATSVHFGTGMKDSASKQAWHVFELN